MLAHFLFNLFCLLAISFVVSASMATEDREAFMQAIANNPQLLAHLTQMFGPDFLDHVPGRLVNLQRLG